MAKVEPLRIVVGDGASSAKLSPDGGKKENSALKRSTTIHSSAASSPPTHPLKIHIGNNVTKAAERRKKLTEFGDVGDNVAVESAIMSSVDAESALTLLHSIRSSTSHSSALSGLSDDDLKKLVMIFSFIDVKEGEEVMKKGERATFCGLILKGELAAKVGGLSIPMKSGAWMGEMAFFEAGVRNADIVAASNSIIAVVRYEEINKLASTNNSAHIEFHVKIIKLLARMSINKILERNEILTKKMDKLYAELDTYKNEAAQRGTAPPTQTGAKQLPPLKGMKMEQNLSPLPSTNDNKMETENKNNTNNPDLTTPLLAPAPSPASPLTPSSFAGDQIVAIASVPSPSSPPPSDHPFTDRQGSVTMVLPVVTEKVAIKGMQTPSRPNSGQGDRPTGGDEKDNKTNGGQLNIGGGSGGEKGSITSMDNSLLMSTRSTKLAMPLGGGHAEPAVAEALYRRHMQNNLSIRDYYIYYEGKKKSDDPSEQNGLLNVVKNKLEELKTINAEDTQTVWEHYHGSSRGERGGGGGAAGTGSVHQSYLQPVELRVLARDLIEVILRLAVEDTKRTNKKIGDMSELKAIIEAKKYYLLNGKPGQSDAQAISAVTKELQVLLTGAPFKRITHQLFTINLAKTLNEYIVREETGKKCIIM